MQLSSDTTARVSAGLLVDLPPVVEGDFDELHPAAAMPEISVATKMHLLAVRTQAKTGVEESGVSGM